MKGEKEKEELLIELSSNLKEGDLTPEDEARLRFALDALKPPPNPLPPELIKQLADIPDKKERFALAAQAVGAADQESLDNLAAAMQQEGLL